MEMDTPPSLFQIIVIPEEERPQLLKASIGSEAISCSNPNRPKGGIVTKASRDNEFNKRRNINPAM
jgi:hypothetical protein